jgi:quercetin dioxygenase-like cupin family protein
MHKYFFIACFTMLAASAGQTQAPQAPAGGAATPPAPQRGVLAEAAGFTGRTTTLDTAGYTIGRRVFEAGAHNATWHAHSAGQLVFAETGNGRLQIMGQPITELKPGDSAFIPGNTMHWHGASPKENFTMVFITMGESKTSTGDPITDATYQGKK